MRSIQRFVLLGVIAFVVLGLGACNGDGEDPETGAQPVQPNDSFPSDALAGLPMPSGAEPLGPPADDRAEGVTAQSFEVVGQSPREIVADYAASLPDQEWETIVEPHEAGRVGWRAEWQRDGAVLELTSVPADDLEGNVTQFNFVLRQGE